MSILVCLLITAADQAAAAQDMWVDSAAFNTVHIVRDADPDDATAAAITLFQKTWKQCTSFAPSISAEPKAGINVWIGPRTLPKGADADQAFSALGRDGVLLKTFQHDSHPALLLTGGKDKGVLYAVYEFFEQRFGVRWLDPETTHIPPAPASLAALDYGYTPPFAHREMNTAGENRDIYRLNSPFHFGINGHSLYNLLPPEKYFSEHPEYYSEIDGKRVAPVNIDWRDIELAGEYPDQFGQLCMSNPATAEAIAHEIDRMAKEKPWANTWAVCQMDWGGNCQCDQCRAIDEREGTPMGSLLTGINRVAELVERDHPGFFIQTYAYAYTRKPPKTLKPRHNVIIQLCDIECDFARPLTDPSAPTNRAFVEDYKIWSGLTHNLLFYDYPVNFWRYQMPHPIYPVFGPNMALYANQKSLGVFQLSVNPAVTPFSSLNLYLLGKLFWNPYADAQAIQDEFIDLYYGGAAPYIKEFIALSVRTLKESGIELSIYDTGGWINRKYIAASEDLFKQAFAAAETDEIRRRVDFAYLQVQFAGLDCRPDLSFTDDTVTMSRPPSISPADYVKRLEHFEVPEMGEMQPRERVLTYYAGAAGTRDLTSKLITLENDAYRLWVAPALEGSVLRFQDKRTKRELLRGYQTYGVFPGTWQDWSDRGTRAESAAAKQYEVVESDSRHVILEARLESGLVLRRTMRLADGDGPLEVELSLHNPTDTPVSAKVKFHPEFNAQEAYAKPEIWLQAAEGWKQLNVEETAPVGYGVLPAGTATRWAAYFPESGFSLVNDFDPAGVDQLLYYYNTHHIALQVNLELLPNRDPLGPDETRTIRATYNTSDKRPSES